MTDKEINYIRIKPQLCEKCDKEYTPVVCSDKCPHSKLSAEEWEAEMTNEEIIERVREDIASIMADTFDWDTGDSLYGRVDQILSHPNLKIVDDKGKVIEDE